MSSARPQPDGQRDQEVTLEIVLELDVVPKGTIDLKSLDAAPGAPPPAVRASPSGGVVGRGERTLIPGAAAPVAAAAAPVAAASSPPEPSATGSDDVPTETISDLPTLAPPPRRGEAGSDSNLQLVDQGPGSASDTNFSADDPSEASEASEVLAAVSGDEASDTGQSKTLLAVDAAVSAPVPPRPEAADEIEMANALGDESWEEFDPELGSPMSVVKVLAYLFALVLLVAGVGLVLLGVIPLGPQEREIADSSPLESPAPEINVAPPPLSVDGGDEPSPPSSPRPPVDPGLEVDPNALGADPQDVEEAIPDPAELEAQLKAQRLADLRELAELITTTGSVEVAEDVPGLRDQIEKLRAEAVQAYRAGDLIAARTKLESLLDLNPEDGDALFRLGLIHHREGEFDQAQNRYLAAIAADPQDPRAHNNLGLVFTAQGDRANALASFQEALKIDPEDANTLANLGGYYEEEAGGASKAKPLYDKVLDKRPDHGPARLGRGRVLVRLGDLNAARQDFGHVAQDASPYAAPARDHLGLLAQRRGNYKEALDWHRRALEANPNHTEAQVHLGMAQLALGQRTDAVKTLEQAVAARPDDPQAWTNLGIARSRVAVQQGPGQLFYDARDAYKKALELDDRNWLTHYNYAICVENFGAFPLAIRHYDLALGLNPRAEGPTINLARIYEEGGAPDKALKVLNDGILRRPDSAEFHYRLAGLHSRQGREDEAKAALSRFVQLAKPNDPRVAEAKRALPGEFR